jgi:hypothetical protein
MNDSKRDNHPATIAVSTIGNERGETFEVCVRL